LPSAEERATGCWLWRALTTTWGGREGGREGGRKGGRERKRRVMELEPAVILGLTSKKRREGGRK
jgi:hypothetical protein